MSEKKKELSEELLTKAAGGIDNATQYQIGDMVTVFDEWYYYFGTITEIFINFGGYTNYIVAYTRKTFPRGGYIEIEERLGRCNFDSITDKYRIIKKITDIPEPRWYRSEEIAPYI